MAFPLFQVNHLEDTIYELTGIKKTPKMVTYIQEGWNGSKTRRTLPIESRLTSHFFTREEAVEFIRRRLQGRLDEALQRAEFYRERQLRFEKSLCEHS